MLGAFREGGTGGGQKRGNGLTCPICGRESPPDTESGYDAPDVCPDCAALGWTYDAHGVLINEQEEDVSEFDQLRR